MIKLHNSSKMGILSLLNQITDTTLKQIYNETNVVVQQEVIGDRLLVEYVAEEDWDNGWIEFDVVVE